MYVFHWMIIIFDHNPENTNLSLRGTSSRLPVVEVGLLHSQPFMNSSFSFVSFEVVTVILMKTLLEFDSMLSGK